MKQLLLTLAAATLLASSAFAQKPGDDKAISGAPAATQKAAGKADGLAGAKITQPGDDRPAKAGKAMQPGDDRPAKGAAKAKLATDKSKVQGAKVSK